MLEVSVGICLLRSNIGKNDLVGADAEGDHKNQQSGRIGAHAVRDVKLLADLYTELKDSVLNAHANLAFAVETRLDDTAFNLDFRKVQEVNVLA